MSEEEINVAIAECCGWKFYEPSVDMPTCCESHWIKDGSVAFDSSELPNYCGDLNAMYDARKQLTQDQQVQYSVELGKLVTSHLPSSRAAWMDFAIADARALQHAMAFLRTLGKLRE